MNNKRTFWVGEACSKCQGVASKLVTFVDPNRTPEVMCMVCLEKEDVKGIIDIESLNPAATKMAVTVKIPRKVLEDDIMSERTEKEFTRSASVGSKQLYLERDKNTFTPLKMWTPLEGMAAIQVIFSMLDEKDKQALLLSLAEGAFPSGRPTTDKVLSIQPDSKEVVDLMARGMCHRNRHEHNELAAAFNQLKRDVYTMFGDPRADKPTGVINAKGEQVVEPKKKLSWLDESMGG